MGYERRVKLFRNGRNQAVRIPREFELPGDEAVMHKEGAKLVIEPARDRAERLRALLEHWRREGPITDEEWPEIDDPPPGAVNF
jgi:antitoxin VapB